MDSSFWLGAGIGFAAIPALLGTGWALRHGYRAVDKALGDVFRRIPLGPTTNRALFAAGCASARRVHIVDLFGISLAVVVGWDKSKAEPIYKVLCRELTPAPSVRKPGARTPQDPGVVFDSDDDPS